MMIKFTIVHGHKLVIIKFGNNVKLFLDRMSVMFHM